MDSEQIIAPLNKQSLLLLSDFLLEGLMYPELSFSEIAQWENFWEIDHDAVEYSKSLNQHEQLKFLQRVVNTLVKESQEPDIGKQLELPVD